MEVKKLSNEKIKKVYNNKLPLDFPPDEIRPWESFESCLNKKLYFGYGLYEENLLSYALFVNSKNSSSVMLDFYAVDSSLRGRGIGQTFLKEIRAKSKDYNGIILEVEDPAFAPNDKEKAIRKRRIEFYKRNKAYVTNIRSNVLGVPFIVMYMPINGKITDEKICEEIKEIYKVLLPNGDKDGDITIRLIQ